VGTSTHIGFATYYMRIYAKSRYVRGKRIASEFRMLVPIRGGLALLVGYMYKQ